VFKWGDVLKEISVVIDGFRFVHSFELFFIYGYSPLTPLTQELNPSAQRCLPNFF
jgi:hypothetical protein